MIVRLVSAKTLKQIDIENVSQVLVFSDTNQPLAIAHQTANGLYIVAKADEGESFSKFLLSLGISSKKVVSAPISAHAEADSK